MLIRGFLCESAAYLDLFHISRYIINDFFTKNDFLCVILECMICMIGETDTFRGMKKETGTQ